jgi:hypothetical protein
MRFPSEVDRSGAAWAADAGEVQKVARMDTFDGGSARGSSFTGEPLWECVKSALEVMHGGSLLIFDWDDTILPTTALAIGGHLRPQSQALRHGESRSAANQDVDVQYREHVDKRRKQLGLVKFANMDPMTVDQCYFGQEVILTGSEKLELNGQVGIIGEYHADSGQFDVITLDNTIHQCKPCNLELCVDTKSFPSSELDACGAAALIVLRAAKKLGNVLIVTNSDHGWVHDSAARFLPCLADELRDIPVISARSIFEPQKVPDKQWKTLCFQRIVKCFHSGPWGIFGVQHLVSIGDSLDEHEATMQVAQWCPCYVKSLKLSERPTMFAVHQQLQLCLRHLPHIVYHIGNLQLDFRQMMSPEMTSNGEKRPLISQATDLHASERCKKEDEPPQKKRCSVLRALGA